MAVITEDAYRARHRLGMLRAAEAVIAEEGLAAVQARRIAQAAGCSVGTLYNVFGDIDGLLLAANERTLADLGRTLTATVERTAATPLGNRLMALATAYLDFATVNQRRWRAVFEHRLPETRTVPTSYAEDRRHLLALIETQLETTIADPDARTDAAYALFAAVHGIVSLALDAKLDPYDPAQCERRIRFIVESVVRGVDPPRGDERSHVR